MTNETTTDKKIDELYKLIDGIEIAMFTTRRTDGALVSRPMANQERISGAELRSLHHPRRRSQSRRQAPERFG